jgi:hypothetical protein
MIILTRTKILANGVFREEKVVMLQEKMSVHYTERYEN